MALVAGGKNQPLVMFITCYLQLPIVNNSKKKQEHSGTIPHIVKPLKYTRQYCLWLEGQSNNGNKDNNSKCCVPWVYE